MINFTVTDSVISSKRVKTVCLSGAATFKNDSELQRAVNNAFHESDQLEINCKGLVKADISFLMLMCATHRTAELLNKRFVVRGAIPPEGILHSEYAFNSRERGCLFAPPRKCRFWRHFAAAFARGEDGVSKLKAAAPLTKAQEPIKMSRQASFSTASP